MTIKTAVWGTGNVGRPAIRAVLANPALELVGVVVANPDKAGKDAGELVGLSGTGVHATTDSEVMLDASPDCVVYTATADIRPEEAMQDLLACLRAGANVVSSSFYSFLYPALCDETSLALVEAACAEDDSSLFISGIDPGWAMDALPLMLSGMVSDVREIRCREIFNYALYDQPHVVREVIGFGGSMDELPMMLHGFALRLVWEPMVRMVGEGMGRPVDAVETVVERRPLEQSIDVPGMGNFEAGTQGAFRFEVQGIVDGQVRYVIEHVTRIDDSCAPDWPYPPEGQGCHQVQFTATPDLTVTIHGEDAFEPGPAGGGNASAACRLVNAIPALVQANPGVVSSLQLPEIRGHVAA